MTTNETIKPCPFCGDDAHIHEVEENCWGCGCKACGYDVLNGPVGIGWHVSRSAATEAWETRHE